MKVNGDMPSSGSLWRLRANPILAAAWLFQPAAYGSGSQQNGPFSCLKLFFVTSLPCMPVLMMPTLQAGLLLAC